MLRRRVVLLALLVLLALVPEAHAFTTTTKPFTLGQAPDWLDDSHVVAHAPVRAATSRSFARRFAEPSVGA